MKLYHGTSCQNRDAIARMGLVPADPAEAIYPEAAFQSSSGVYLTDNLSKARSYACETTKTKDPDYTEPIDLETIYPNSFDVCIYEVSVPKTSLEQDEVDERSWRTKDESIPPRFLTLLLPDQVTRKLGIEVGDLCALERAEVEYNLSKLRISQKSDTAITWKLSAINH